MSSQNNTDVANDLFHHAEYGAPPDPPTKRVVASDLDNIAIWPRLPLTAEWDQVVPASQITRLLYGSKSECMEEKWNIYTEGPDAEGVAVIRMFRSWTGFHIYDVILQVAVHEDGSVKAGEDAVFSGIAWVDNPDTCSCVYTEEEAKEIVLEICRWCLGVELP